MVVWNNNQDPPWKCVARQAGALQVECLARWLCVLGKPLHSCRL